ncbi:hypothetical protein COY95_02610, partial [Candidatus Woesearchaeota archaeon CG_4_10_14_0_8_um_filter_47_5]
MSIPMISSKISDKIKQRNELARLCTNLRKQGKTIGFTSGAFDLLHQGHARYLEQARERCDVLVVGVNSDDSVRRFKGPGRPILPEKDRAVLVAALAAVDYVFIFNERRNQANIELLRPDFYIKAGDYTPDKLTSKEAVEKYGGKIIILPLVEGCSSTAMIQKIASQASQSGAHIASPSSASASASPFPSPSSLSSASPSSPPASSPPPSSAPSPALSSSASSIPSPSLPSSAYHSNFPLVAEPPSCVPSKMRPAIFLDRDGVINQEIEYLHDPKKFRLTPHALEGLKKLQEFGYPLIIITNQAGIGLGYYTKEEFFAVNKRMLTELSGAGIILSRIYYCPHSLAEDCDCRKPKPGMLLRARNELNLDLCHSYIIGDKETDIAAG